MIDDNTDGHEVNNANFNEVTCSAWCPTHNSTCQVCKNLTSVMGLTIQSCGDDNTANQIGSNNVCRQSNMNSVASEAFKTGALACECGQDTGCYCYCIIKDCICSSGTAVYDFKTTKMSIISALTLFVMSQANNKQYIKINHLSLS